MKNVRSSQYKIFLLMSLDNIISKSIKDNNNPIGFDVFMNLALYHPEFGYYRSDKTIFGHKGDFITSPEVSDLFGFSLAKQCKQALHGRDILEFGAGTGILAAQILFELGRLKSLPKRYFIIELSAQLRQNQKETIKKILPELWIELCGLLNFQKDLKAL
jgi:SAM-dependent MidA family methyltransferase